MENGKERHRKRLKVPSLPGKTHTWELLAAGALRTPNKLRGRKEASPIGRGLGMNRTIGQWDMELGRGGKAQGMGKREARVMTM